MRYGLLGPVTIEPYAATAPVLTLEARQRSLPVADGGYNEAELLVTNASDRPVSATLTATGADGIAATAPAATSIPAGGSVTVPVAVRNTGLASHYPRILPETTTAQDRFPEHLAVDGSPASYYASWAGADRPEPVHVGAGLRRAGHIRFGDHRRASRR